MRIRNSRNKLKILLVIAIVVTLITGLSTTYAFFIYRVEGSNVSLETGDIKIAFANGKNYFNVEDSYPVSDSTGKVLPYYSDFTVNATTSDVDIMYEIPSKEDIKEFTVTKEMVEKKQLPQGAEVVQLPMKQKEEIA